MSVRIVSLIFAKISISCDSVTELLSDRPGTGDAYKSKNAPKD